MRTIIIILIFLILNSCKQSNESKIVTENLTDSTTIKNDNNETDNQEKENNFTAELTKMNFENIPNYLLNGPSLVVDFKLKNNTSNKILKYKIKYFIEIVFEDNTFLYSPMYYEKDTVPATDEIWNHPSILDVSLPKGDIWLPNTEREFHLVNFGTYAPGWKARNFDKSIFERTPKMVSLITKYEAISVDKEYTDIQKIDLIENWKKYQAEIGLR